MSSTAQKVHAGTVKRFGITLPLPGKRFIQRICIRPARQKIAYRIAKRVVHNAVQLVPENKLSQPASRNTLFEASSQTSPRSTPSESSFFSAVRSFFINSSGNSSGNIQPPRRYTAACPFFEHAFCQTNIIGLKLVHLRQGFEPPPASVLIREMFEFVPFIQMANPRRCMRRTRDMFRNFVKNKHCHPRCLKKHRPPLSGCRIPPPLLKARVKS